ncbi:hypothetical protein JTB14_000199 [Gonioctena quinquepunctata]|nr:hypothetical protein JTB14_000199 [Gonioctena quinquepunctata]
MDFRDGKTVPREGEGGKRENGEEQSHGDGGDTSVPQMSHESQVQEGTSVEQQTQMLMNFIATKMDGMQENMGRMGNNIKEGVKEHLKENIERLEENMRIELEENIREIVNTLMENTGKKKETLVRLNYEENKSNEKGQGLSDSVKEILIKSFEENFQDCGYPENPNDSDFVPDDHENI